MIPSCEPKKEKLHFSCILPGWTQLLRWRRRWDSNPRAPEGNCISSAARYDHFDTSPQIQTGKNRSENYLYNISFCSYKVNRKNGGILQRVLTVKTYVTIREILCYHLIRTFELQTYLSCPVVSILMLLHLFPKFFLTGKYFSPI